MEEAKKVYIRTQGDLEGLCARLAASERFAFDTEFHRERTFRPHLCLVQVALPDLLALVDPLAGLDLSAFHRVLQDPGVEKVVHAAVQDLEISYRATGRMPRRIFDTQVAAAFAGFSDQTSYEKLVSEISGARLSKGETMSDWARRPLSDEQMDYAYDDVRYLLAIRDELVRRLDSLGRRSWAGEELLRLEDPDRFEYDPEKDYREIRGAWNLDPRGLSVLRELARWREDEAIQSDEPRSRIARDEALLALSRRAPRTPRELKGNRSLHPAVVERCSQEILQAVHAGVERARTDPPAAIPRPENDPALAARVDLLWAYVRGRAAELGIGAQTLSSRESLAALAAAPPGSAAGIAALPAFGGWRGEILAADLADILAGRKALSLADPGPGNAPLALAPVDPAATGVYNPGRNG
ncbi:MAG: ribonuclease D [Planctomycetes bacterium]|nr:ribonuclease D [Planctomycetota bacterium]